MMYNFFSEKVYHFHQIFKMLLDLEKVKQCILLRAARILAQVLRLSGQPSHKFVLAYSTEKVPHLIPGCIQFTFLLPAPSPRQPLPQKARSFHSPLSYVSKTVSFLLSYR